MGRRTDLLFKHEDAETEHEDKKTRVHETLNEICNSEDIRPDSARLFSELVYRVRELSETGLNEIHRDVQGNRVCQKNHEKAQ